jgi:hypothetical protein
MNNENQTIDRRSNDTLIRADHEHLSFMSVETLLSYRNDMRTEYRNTFFTAGNGQLQQLIEEVKLCNEQLKLRFENAIGCKLEIENASDFCQRA